MKKKMIAMIRVGCLCITACQSTKSNTGTEERKAETDKNKFKQNAYALILRNCLEMLLKEKMPIVNKHNRSMIKQ